MAKKKQDYTTGKLVTEALARFVTADAENADVHDLAVDLTLDEALKQQVGIAQVKELLGCLGRRWRRHPEMILAEVAAIVERAGRKGRRR